MDSDFPQGWIPPRHGVTRGAPGSHVPPVPLPIYPQGLPPRAQEPGARVSDSDSGEESLQQALLRICGLPGGRDSGKPFGGEMVSQFGPPISPTHRSSALASINSASATPSVRSGSLGVSTGYDEDMAAAAYRSSSSGSGSRSSGSLTKTSSSVSANEAATPSISSSSGRSEFQHSRPDLSALGKIFAQVKAEQRPIKDTSHPEFNIRDSPHSNSYFNGPIIDGLTASSVTYDPSSYITDIDSPQGYFAPSSVGGYTIPPLVWNQQPQEARTQESRPSIGPHHSPPSVVVARLAQVRKLAPRSRKKTTRPHRPISTKPKHDKDDTYMISHGNISLDTIWEEIEDISRSIVQVDERPSVTTGRFCDLFIGTHDTQGKVALKRPRIDQQDYSTGDVRRFLREVKTWQGLRHEFILPLFGVCRLGNDLFMVSPFMENGTLKNYLAQNSTEEELRLLYEIAEALAYLHGLGVIHGDIKCNNVLVSNDIHALLCDFGLTRLSSSCTSTTLKGAGTTRWQSPELMISGEGKTTESDTWAFGMTIYEVLSEMNPFSQYQQDAAVITALLQRNERPPTDPMFSPNDAPYYPAWRTAVYCWTTEPSRRPPMKDVVRMLKPPRRIRTATESPEGVPTPANSPPSDSSPDSTRRPPVDLADRGGDEASVGRESEPEDYDDEEDEEDEEDEGKPYCYCAGYPDEDMIQCQNASNCRLEWFHFSCLGDESIMEPWYCLECEAKIRES